jgi:hypothetical protein
MAFTIDDNNTDSTKNRNSRLVQGGTTDIYKNRLGWWERRVIPRADDDLRIVIEDNEAGRPDMLSQRAYGKAMYAWLILQFNNIIDPETELVAGKEIFLPTEQRLILDIITKPNGGNKK